jgi:type IV secretion system protein VirD4
MGFYGHRTEKHLLSIAPTRTGKGRSIILTNLLDMKNKSVFVIDPKGENALVSATYRRDVLGNRIIIFNPYGIFKKEFEERGFLQFQTFNPLANLDPESPAFADDVANIAEALVYEETGGESHWVQAARGYIEFLIMFLVTDPEEKANNTVTLGRLRQIIAGGFSSLIETPEPESKDSPPSLNIIEKACKSTFHLVQDNVGRYDNNNSEVRDLIATAETQTRILKSQVICSALEGDALDFEEMKNAQTSVYLILPSERLVTQGRYLRLVLLAAMSNFMRSEKGEHQVVVMLDEFANLGRLNIIANGYGLIAGHGVTLWSFVQNLTQLQNLYPNNWETFIANSSVVTVSNVNDVTTAHYFSRRAGQSQVSKETENGYFDIHPSLGGERVFIGKSASITRVWENSLPVSRLYEASPDDVFLFYEGQSKPTQCQKVFYDIDEKFSEQANKNPMHVDKKQLI